MKIIERLFSLILGSVFLLAGFSKGGDLGGFYHALRQSDVLPVTLQGLAVLFIPGIELTVGACLICLSRCHEIRVASAALLGVFTIIVSLIASSGTHVGCGCINISIPIWFEMSGWIVLGRNIVLLSMSIFLLRRSRRGLATGVPA